MRELSFKEWLLVNEGHDFLTPQYVTSYLFALVSWPTVITAAQLPSQALLDSISFLASILAVPEMPYEPLKQLGKALWHVVKNLGRFFKRPDTIARKDLEPVIGILQQAWQQIKGESIDNLMEVLRKITIEKGKIWDEKQMRQQIQHAQQVIAAETIKLNQQKNFHQKTG
jgi:hypothetical protein